MPSNSEQQSRVRKYLSYTIGVLTDDANKFSSESGKRMARDNVKHGTPQVGITMMGERDNRERNPMCSREIGG